MKGKLSPESMIKRIKSKEATEKKANFTFRLNVQLMEDFKENCERHEVSMASMVEEAIRILVHGE